MNKLIICTVGTSISNGCTSQRKVLSKVSDWNDELKEFELEIKERIKGKKDTELRTLSAEINSLDRLGISPNDKVILLSSDNAPGRICSEYLRNLIQNQYGIANDNIVIERILGLQVYDSSKMKKEGLKNFVSTAIKYIADKSLSYQYDMIINPTGGFKGVLPFLTILGMMYGKKIIYIFEFSEELIYLPPLPFTFDLDLFNRAMPALRYIEKEIAVNERQYFSKITGFTESEKDLFLSFVEPFDERLLTISSLAYSLLTIEDAAPNSQILKDIADDLKKDNSIPGLALKRLISKSSSPLWRNSHSKNWCTTDLIIIKQARTAERIAGFIEKDTFYITHAFRSHDEYELKLKNCKIEDYTHSEFEEWFIDDSIGVATDNDDNGLILERDKFLLKNKELKNKIEVLDSKTKTVYSRAKEAEAVNEKLKTEICNLKQEIISKEESYIELKTEYEKKEKNSIFSKIRRILGINK